jgi:hypothetical protein
MKAPEDKVNPLESGAFFIFEFAFLRLPQHYQQGL